MIELEEIHDEGARGEMPKENSDMNEVEDNDPCSISNLETYWLDYVLDKFVPKVFDNDENLLEIRNVWKGVAEKDAKKRLSGSG